MIRYIALLSGLAWHNGSVFGQTVSFRAPVSYQITGAVRGNRFCGTCMAVGDLNGDGIQDIVFSNDGAGLYAAGILLGNRFGTFDKGTMPDWAELYSRNNVLIADFNGDGKPDIHLDGPIILLGKGDGSFAAPIKSQGCLSTAFAADLNHDCKVETILWRPLHQKAN